MPAGPAPTIITSYLSLEAITASSFPNKNPMI
jgi:hypothetical protein